MNIASRVFLIFFHIIIAIFIIVIIIVTNSSFLDNFNNFLETEKKKKRKLKNTRTRMDSVHSLKHLNIGQNLRVISRRIFNFKNMSRKRLDFFRKNVCKKSLTLPFISPFDRHYLSTPSLRFFSARFKNRRQDGLSRDVARTNSEIKVKESRKERKTSLNREP